MPTSRPPSTTSTQSVSVVVHPPDRLGASARRVGSTDRRGGAPSASRCSPSSRPRNVDRRLRRCRGRARSAPQLSQMSAPIEVLEAADAGRVIPRAPSWLLDRPGLAAAQRPRRGRPRRTSPPPPSIWSSISSVVGRPLDRAQDADRHREVRPEHPRQDQREVRVLGVLVVDEQVRLGDAVLADASRPPGAGRCRRMPLSRSLPKIIGLPCSRTSIRSSRTSRSVKSRQAPSLKMLQFWRTSTNDEPLVAAGPLERLLEVLGVGVDRARDERRLGGERDRQRHGSACRPCPSASTSSSCRTPTSGDAWPLVRP